MILEHLQRIEDALTNQFSLTNLAGWIQKNTYLNGRPFSFKGYEYQIPILEDTARTSIIVKCAQIGLSELAYRYAVATCCTQDNWTLIYTFPTSSDAQKQGRQRIDPMIEASPELQRLIDPNQNNSEMKKFGANSFLMFNGTQSENASISTPANAVIHDEVDKSDLTKMSVYVSRLQNRPHKIRKLFSTPTIPKYGISKEAETANRHKHLVDCNRCGHIFLPDYFTDVIIPGWDKPMDEINKRNLNTVKFRQAWLKCPKCGRDPQLHHTRMPFVCENPGMNYENNAWFISPFSAHEVLTLPNLIQSSTEYEKYNEFINQGLGLTREDKNEQLIETDFHFLPSDLRSSDFHCMGIDVGQTCHVTIGRMTLDGDMVIVHRERVPLSRVEVRSLELTAAFRVIMTVWDGQPETNLVQRVCASRPNNFGAWFVNTKSLTSYAVKDKEGEDKEGSVDVKIVNLNRTSVLDALRDLFKAKKVILQQSPDDDLYIKQMTSLKRVQKFVKNELSYIWEKMGDEEDHFHFSTLYLHIAMCIRGVAGGFGISGAGVSLISKTKGPNYQSPVAVARPIIKLN